MSEAPPSQAAPLRIGVRFRLAADPGEMLADARAVEAAGADSIWVDAADAEPYVALAAIAAVTWRARLFARGAIGAGRETCASLSRGRLVVAEECPERWVELPFPAGRDEWNAKRAEIAADGATGVILPNDPRLIDLLRNPDVVEDRSDLKLSFG